MEAKETKMTELTPIGRRQRILQGAAEHARREGALPVPLGAHPRLATPLPLAVRERHASVQPEISIIDHRVPLGPLVAELISQMLLVVDVERRRLPGGNIHPLAIRERPEARRLRQAPLVNIAVKDEGPAIVAGRVARIEPRARVHLDPAQGLGARVRRQRRVGHVLVEGLDGEQRALADAVGYEYPRRELTDFRGGVWLLGRHCRSWSRDRLLPFPISIWQAVWQNGGREIQQARRKESAGKMMSPVSKPLCIAGRKLTGVGAWSINGSRSGMSKHHSHTNCRIKSMSSHWSDRAGARVMFSDNG